MNDEIFPIEDSIIPLQHGSVKEARYAFFSRECSMTEYPDRLYSFIPNAVHMGEPAVGPIIMHWVEGLLGTKDAPKTS